MNSIEPFQGIPVSLISDTVISFGWCHSEAPAKAPAIAQCSGLVSHLIKPFLTQLAATGNGVLSLAPMVTNLEVRESITGYIIVLRDTYGTKVRPATIPF